MTMSVPAPEAESSEEELEQEYHTEDSEENDLELPAEGAVDDGDVTEDGDSEDEVDDRPAAPYLPEHLLKAPIGPPPSTLRVTLPENMNRKQRQDKKRTIKSRQRRVKRRIQRKLEGTGVLEAGIAAQIKRGIVPVPKRDRVQSGRVGKKSKKVEVSGRQQLLEARKRVRADSEGARPAKKGKVKAKAKAKSKG